MCPFARLNGQNIPVQQVHVRRIDVYILRTHSNDFFHLVRISHMMQLDTVQLQLRHLFQELLCRKFLRQAVEFLVFSPYTGVHVIVVPTAVHLLVVLHVRAVVPLVHLGNEGCQSGCLVATWLQLAQE